MKKVLGVLLAVILGVSTGVLCFTSVEFATVVGNGMLPTYEDGDMLLVNKRAYGQSRTPGYGDIVVFPAKIFTADGEGRCLVKRVVATEGEQISIGKGVVFVNHRPLAEPYLFTKGAGGEMPQTAVNPDCVFVLGDNRAVSLDSRDESVGQITKEEITGKVVCRLWPFR